ncbi:Uncharacterised protein [Mycobacteroides abscessus subsp. massiliense]|nr:Uncharacterised protein [Mycobacteroides abscessus subsp. massiliense]
MGMYFDTLGYRAAAANQEVFFSFIVVDFHECATHFHTFNGRTCPTVFNMDTGCRYGSCQACQNQGCH